MTVLEANSEGKELHLLRLLHAQPVQVANLAYQDLLLVDVHQGHTTMIRKVLLHVQIVCLVNTQILLCKHHAKIV